MQITQRLERGRVTRNGFGIALEVVEGLIELSGLLIGVADRLQVLMLARVNFQDSLVFRDRVLHLIP